MQKTLYPHEEIRRATIALSAMRIAQTLDVYEEYWKEFLRRLERSWNKVIAHYGKSPKWTGWNSKYERLRRTDELLCYLLNARGAEEHTVNEITEKEPGSIGINQAFGNVLFIERLTINNGVMDIRSPMPLQIDVRSPRVKLLAVTNRGRTYEIPRAHLGAGIDPTEVVHLAELGLKFYENAIADAEAFFVR